MNSNVHKLVFILYGFIAYSDFGSISHVVLPLILVIHAFRLKSSTLLILAALSITDLGLGDTFTPELLRKFIIILILLNIIYELKFQISLYIIFLLATVFISTLYNAFFGITNSNTFVRDLFVLFLLFMPGLRIDIPPIIYFGIGSTFGIIFVHFFTGMAFTDYHSYTSTKSIMALPLFYFLSRNKISLINLLLIFSSVFAIILLQTRMILLAIAMVLLFRFILTMSFRKILTVGLLFYLLPLVLVTLPGAKSVQVFIDIFSFFRSFDIDYLKFLDPVRWGEHKLFFSRNAFEIMFGSGFGSGLNDSQDILGFVTVDQTAFSRLELSNNVFFNLHDTWIDLGLRFGLLPILFVYFLLIRNLRNFNWYLAGSGIVFLSNMSFSYLGLLIIFIFMRAIFSKKRYIINFSDLSINNPN